MKLLLLVSVFVFSACKDEARPAADPCPPGDGEYGYYTVVNTPPRGEAMARYMHDLDGPNARQILSLDDESVLTIYDDAESEVMKVYGAGTPSACAVWRSRFDGLWDRFCVNGTHRRTREKP